jgi:uncharacterized protein YheU (UPF0270 family)
MTASAEPEKYCTLVENHILHEDGSYGENEVDEKAGSLRTAVQCSLMLAK